MPWTTPTLKEVRRLNRDNLAAYLPGADATVPNSVVRVMSDQNAGGAHLTLRYVDYVATNLLPDKGETEWLDRWANIYLGGRKAATFAAGQISVTGTEGVLLPIGTQLASSDAVTYQTTAPVYLSSAATPAPVLALTAGSVGNREQGATLSLSTAVAGVDAQATVLEISGGADVENDDDLRARVLLRIRKVPMGGSADDYIRWALEVPGVTRAWSSPNGMGIGTVVVRFMCDDLRAGNGGFPLSQDIEAVRAHLDEVRPVAVKDFFAVAPIAYPLAISIDNLSRDTPSTRTAIAKAVREMLYDRAAPGQTVYASWVAEAISGALGEDHHDLIFDNAVMPSPGHMATLGSITYL